MKNLIEEKYSIKSRLDLMPRDLQKLFSEFFNTVMAAIFNQQPDFENIPWVWTHIRGVTFFCSNRKAFIFSNFNRTYIGLNFYTGSQSISGLEKTTWARGKDKKGGYYRLQSKKDLDLGVKFAKESYIAAIAENSS